MLLSKAVKTCLTMLLVMVSYMKYPTTNFLMLGLRKGEEAKDHKYIKREWKNGRWQYTYPDDVNNMKLSSLTSLKKVINSKAKNIKDNKIGTKTNNIIKPKNNTKIQKYLGSLLSGINTNSNPEKLVSIGRQVMVKVQNGGSNNQTNKSSENDTKRLEEKVKELNEFLESKGDPTEVADAISESNSPKSWSELKHKDREYTKEEDQAIINPNYVSAEEEAALSEKMSADELMELWEVSAYTGIESYEYTINCQSCTLAYDMRQRGYDVEAAPYDWNESWYSDEAGLSTWYEGVTTDDWVTSELPPTDMSINRYGSDGEYTPEYKTMLEKRSSEMYDRIEKLFADMPNGSYGQFCVDWTLGGGHSIVWEKNDGNVLLRDCQINQTYRFDEIRQNDTYYNHVKKVYVLRTDDKKLTDEALKRVRNADHVEEIDKVIEKLRKKYGKGVNE